MKNTIEQNSKSILIAEDEKSYLSALILKLQHAGFDAQGAEDGEQTLNLLKSKKFDLLILDLIMPKVNGFIVLEEMRKLGIKTPVVVLSNLTQEEDKVKVKDLGVEMFIEKSNTAITDVVNQIQELFKN